MPGLLWQMIQGGIKIFRGLGMLECAYNLRLMKQWGPRTHPIHQGHQKLTSKRTIGISEKVNGGFSLQARADDGSGSPWTNIFMSSWEGWGSEAMKLRWQCLTTKSQCGVGHNYFRNWQGQRESQEEIVFNI